MYTLRYYVRNAPKACYLDLSLKYQVVPLGSMQITYL